MRSRYPLDGIAGMCSDQGYEPVPVIRLLDPGGDGWLPEPARRRGRQPRRHDHRYRCESGVPLDDGQKFPARHDRHLQVEQDETRFRNLTVQKQGEGLASVRRLEHRVPCTFQHGTETSTQTIVVIDDEDWRRSPFPPLRRSQHPYHCKGTYAIQSRNERLPFGHRSATSKYGLIPTDESLGLSYTLARRGCRRW